MFDLIIRNGRIIDGTGAPSHHGDVAIKDGKIVKIGRKLAGDTAKEIDVGGLVIAPGFIDAHSHGDMAVENFPQSTYKLEQGVTTEIGGMCGHAPAPFSADHLEDCRRTSVTLIADGAALDYESRSTFGTFLKKMQTKSIGTNMGFLMGHGTIRAAVMGYEHRDPTPDELRRMCEYVAEGMEHGAMGISFGLIYPPGAYAKTEEMIEICKVVEKYGGLFTIHMRNEGSRLNESVEEVITMVKETGIKGVISHHKASGGKGNWGKPYHTLGRIEEVNEEGYDLFVDQYPYTASSTGLNTDIPQDMHSLGTKRILEILADPNERIALEKSVLGGKTAQQRFSGTMIGNSLSHPHLAGRMLLEAAEEEGKTPCDLLFDLLLADELSTGGIFWGMCETDIELIMSYPRTMIGTDGLYYPGSIGAHPRAFGTFPRVLGRYCREQGLFTVEEAVHKMTGLPAMVYNLTGKGLIREGMDADITIFDPETIIDNADYKNFNAKCTGIHYVFMAGELVVTDAVHDGRMLGKAILK